MDDQTVPSEMVEITSFEHLREQFLSAAERVESGERVAITLYDPQGFSLPVMFGQGLIAGGLGIVFDEVARPKGSEALPYPMSRLPELGPYKAPQSRSALGDMTEVMFGAD